MDLSRPTFSAQSNLLLMSFVTCLSIAACNGGGGDDDSSGSADTTISITETFNVDAGESAVMQAFNTSITNGSGISKIIGANAASPQPGNGYTASTVAILNSTNNSTVDTIDFAANGLSSGATAAQLAEFFEIQNDYIDATAVTIVRLTLSTAAVSVGDQFSVNGSSINGDTRSEVMADINAVPDIDASIDSNGVITVIASDGDDLRLNLGNATAGQTIGIDSLLINEGTVIVFDSATIGYGQPHAKATVGGVVSIMLDYPLQLASTGISNIFDAVISSSYSVQNEFDVTDPDTYNHAASVALTDSLGNQHQMAQYFVKQDDLAGTAPNRWAMYVLVDEKNVGSPDVNGEPTPARFDLAFDSNGQLDPSITDPIEISEWTPLDENGDPNGADSARITIDITGSTQFGGAFSLTNVHVD
jgi:flagellar hook protein FlgE